jgi:hypothetical protein
MPLLFSSHPVVFAFMTVSAPLVSFKSDDHIPIHPLSSTPTCCYCDRRSTMDKQPTKQACSPEPLRAFRARAWHRFKPYRFVMSVGTKWAFGMEFLKLFALERCASSSSRSQNIHSSGTVMTLYMRLGR